ncbi:MAG: hypothetical protein N2320_06560 [Candidatus Bipolaricaulota bacterium]|nr:hypothetical protein [Candidatus Bipolaricaulota bacterium]
MNTLETRIYIDSDGFRRWTIEPYEGDSIRVEKRDADGNPWLVSYREAGPFASRAEAEQWLRERGLEEGKWSRYQPPPPFPA